MFELRWVIRHGWDGPERVLQYRVKEDRTIRAELPGNEMIWRGSYPSMSTPQWSPWIDVPTVDQTTVAEGDSGH